ncbi:hypothetical protein ABH930_006727 [Kitasatospora sp. GAS204A]|nr:hypothetical protein [Kitasatospora sp. GAS204B]
MSRQLAGCFQGVQRLDRRGDDRQPSRIAGGRAGPSASDRREAHRDRLAGRCRVRRRRGVGRHRAADGSSARAQPAAGSAQGHTRARLGTAPCCGEADGGGWCGPATAVASDGAAERGVRGRPAGPRLRVEDKGAGAGGLGGRASPAPGGRRGDRARHGGTRGDLRGARLARGGAAGLPGPVPPRRAQRGAGPTPASRGDPPGCSRPPRWPVSGRPSRRWAAGAWSLDTLGFARPGRGPMPGLVGPAGQQIAQRQLAVMP